MTYHPLQCQEPIAFQIESMILQARLIFLTNKVCRGKTFSLFQYQCAGKIHAA